jgi:hypothetical protein
MAWNNPIAIIEIPRSCHFIEKNARSKPKIVKGKQEGLVVDY